MGKNEYASDPINPAEVRLLMDPTDGCSRFIEEHIRDGYSRPVLCSCPTEVLKYLGDSDG